MKVHPLNEVAGAKDVPAVRMTVEEFCELADLPGCAPGEIAPSSDPDAVAAASDPDLPLPVSVVYVKKEKQWRKLDGHRRAKLWECGALPSPGYVVAEVVQVASLDAARKARNAL